MSYVFDNSPLSVLFKNFYRNTFRSLWENFDALVADGGLSRRARHCARSMTERPKICWHGPKTTPSYLQRQQPPKPSLSPESTECLISSRTLSSKSFSKAGKMPTLS